MIIALAGHSGLTGKLCLQILIDSPTVEKIVTIGRRPATIRHSKIVDKVLIEGKLSSEIRADGFISCLGTTMSKAGSKNAFRAVDFELPIYLAEQLKSAGCKSAAVISAVGANPSSLLTYTKTKGDMEYALREINFLSLSLIRPSFIIGDRQEKRRGEFILTRFLQGISPLLIGPLANFRPVSAEAIASTLVGAILSGQPGVQIYNRNRIVNA